MDRYEGLARAFVGLADTLVADFDVIELAQQLVENAMTPAAGRCGGNRPRRCARQIPGAGLQQRTDALAGTVPDPV